MGKFSALWDALRKGQEVGNADVLKNGAAAGSAIGGLILALWSLGKAFGLELPEVNESQALLWGTGIGSVLAFVNGWVHLATSKRVGFGSEPATTTGIGQDAQRAAVEPIDDNARKAGL